MAFLAHVVRVVRVAPVACVGICVETDNFWRRFFPSIMGRVQETELSHQGGFTDLAISPALTSLSKEKNKQGSFSYCKPLNNAPGSSLTCSLPAQRALLAFVGTCHACIYLSSLLPWDPVMYLFLFTPLLPPWLPACRS